MNKKKQLKSFIDGAIYENNPVHGMTPINHRVRVALKLTMEEYAMAHLVALLKKEERSFDYERVFTRLGIRDKEEVTRITDSLFEKKIFKVVEGVISVTAAWTDAHKTNTNEEFEKFWQPVGNRVWPGSKPLALEKYEETSGVHSHDYLLQQKIAYFRFLDLPENAFRSTMQATEFLNLKTQRFAEEWEMQSKNIMERRVVNGRPVSPPTNGKTLTKKEKDNMF